MSEIANSQSQQVTPTLPKEVVEKETHATHLSVNCLNCGATVSSNKYCAACGQKVMAPDPTFHDLTHEFTHELLHVDGRLLRTIKLLFTRPGFLTKEHCLGRRTRYLGPLRIYLIFSIVFFAVATLAPIQATVRYDTKINSVMRIGAVGFGERFIQGRTPEQVTAVLQRAEHDWEPRLLFAFVPVWALLTMAMARRAKRHFPQHMYFALHIQAAFFGIAVPTRLVKMAHVQTVRDLAVIAEFSFVFWYTIVAIRTVYGGSWWWALSRGAGILISYWISVQLAVGFLFVAALLWM